MVCLHSEEPEQMVSTLAMMIPSHKFAMQGLGFGMLKQTLCTIQQAHHHDRVRRCGDEHVHGRQDDRDPEPQHGYGLD